MRALQKKLVSAAAIGGVLILAAGVVSKSSLFQSDAFDAASTEFQDNVESDKKSAYQSASVDLIFWYEDASYTSFFEKAAIDYFEKTGIKVSVQCKENIDYMGAIYDETMQDGSFPDVYLISGDNLEEAYLYGLASVNEKGVDGANVAENAIKASTYGEKLFGYPLSYNTCVFIYQTDYFETAPASLQSIIDYSNENEPAENVEYLLEWDVNDAFYDFPFISNSVTFKKTEPEIMDIVYDEGLYQKDLEYFEGILTSFSVDAQNVSEESIIDNFLNGRTLSAIIDTDSLYQLEGYGYSLMKMPNLNEELLSYTCATTDMILVNDFSKENARAADFAQFVTVAMSDQLHPMSGHYSVIPSKEPDWVEQVAYDSYETAVLSPASLDAKEFWITLEETISKYF